ncbi:cation-translocating P-type ATPase [Lapidilactobacillus luobeiensis]|uniref:cation-translocating P-type ATPase n=1 Tax=Lapidilactobacillus luobeiensis TaxID=2950371 RepID=UPI0021C2B277|nr:cation-transporting P-type ATPase [Lapidilactobacillus luobeiensis]
MTLRKATTPTDPASDSAAMMGKNAPTKSVAGRADAKRSSGSVTTAWATLSTAASLQAAGSRPTGLTAAEAAQRLQENGPNLIQKTKQTSMFKVFFKNFSSLMALLLWGAGIIAVVAGMTELGLAIWAVNLINGCFSFWQQYRANAATSALQKMLPSYAKVTRGGQAQKVLVEELVPGDLVNLKSGDNVPADGRLLQADDLEVNQSALTGESLTVTKEATAMSATEIQAAGRFAERDLVYEGTAVVKGSGTMLVTGTGMDTEFGQIAALTGKVVAAKSPLERELDLLTRQISIIAFVIGALFFVAAVFLVHYPVAESFIFALGMIVAFIPEGLLPTVTLSLAMAVQKMAHRNALVKHLNSVETLGATTVICSDKTGTLTKNEMTIEQVWLPGGQYQVSGTGYEPIGVVTKNGARIDLSQEPDLLQLLRVGALNNDSFLQVVRGKHEIVGSPDEGSILVLAGKADYDLPDEQKKFQKLDELPFDSERKRMTTIRQNQTATWAFTRGGIAEVLACCQTYLVHGKILPLTPILRQQFLTQNDAFARAGLRILAYAYRQLAENETTYSITATEHDLTFVGLTASQDPPRENVIEAIQKCHDASIRIIMVTGDYGLTAESIAHKIGVVQGNDVRVVTGEQLTAMSDAELRENLGHQIIFARMAPEQKYRIVTNLQEMGEIVAATGDGVNDAPALKKADIGVAMGVTGTDVAKEAADMILTDDNFASIVNAIEEGRTVYANIRKFLLYILNSNMPEAVPSVLFLFSNGLIPLPLTVMQILSIDLGTDMLPALGLASEPTEPGTMARPPRKRSEHLLNRSVAFKAFAWYGLWESLIATAAYFFVNWRAGWPEQALASSGEVYRLATTMTLAAIVFSQIGTVFNCRTKEVSLFKTGIFSNTHVIFGVICEVCLLSCLIYIPFLQQAFNTTGLHLQDWAFLITIPIPLILIEELRKSLLRRRQQQ